MSSSSFVLSRYFCRLSSLISNFLLPLHQNFCFRICHRCLHFCRSKSSYRGGQQLEKSPTAKELAQQWTDTTWNTFCRAKSFDGFSVDYSPVPNVGTWFLQSQVFRSFHLIHVHKEELDLSLQGQLGRLFWFFLFWDNSKSIQMGLSVSVKDIMVFFSLLYPGCQRMR